MNRTVAAGLAAVLALVLAAPLASGAPAAKPRVAVLPLMFKSAATKRAFDARKWANAGRTQMQDVFVTELRGTQVSPLTRAQLNTLARGRGLVLSGDVDPSTARMLRENNVQYGLESTLTRYGYTNPKAPPAQRIAALTQTLSLIDTSTGEIEWTSAITSQVSVGGFGGGVDDDRVFKKLAQANAAKAADAIDKAKP